MQSDLNNIVSILYKYLGEVQLSYEELAMLTEWLDQSPANGELLEELKKESELKEYLSIRLDNKREDEAIGNYLKNTIGIETVSNEFQFERSFHRVHFLRKWWWAAACIVLIITGVVFSLLHSGMKEPEQVSVKNTNSSEIQPGRSGAILILADGSKMVLDSIQNGEIALQGGAKAKVFNGLLVYQGQGNGKLFNTMSTPKGRQFQVALPDGTAVWLNAASSIRFPTTFIGNERKVEITGEVYFEVKKDFRPFIVLANNRTEITVLGTHFNVNCYNNETNIKTTLLEGAVQVSRGPQSIILKPGDQAVVQENSILSRKVDLEKVMAWKAGLFNFENVSLEDAMRQLERWYDIEVIYENGIPNLELEGEMSKDITLNGLMKILKALGVQYRMEDRKLFIIRK